MSDIPISNLETGTVVRVGDQRLVVLGEWEADGWMLLSPLAQLNYPPCTGDLGLTTEGLEGFNVLQVWNTRIGSLEEHAKLQTAVVVGNLNAVDLHRGRKLWNHVGLGDDLLEELRPHIGTPIYMLSDPRIRYQDASAMAFNWL